MLLQFRVSLGIDEYTVQLEKKVKEEDAADVTAKEKKLLANKAFPQADSLLSAGPCVGEKRRVGMFLS